MKEPCVYIAASKPDGVLYIGVTSDLHGRMSEHDQGLVEGFTKRYSVKVLVYCEFHESMHQAILRESQLKKWRRAWKVRLIEGMNPEWANLFDPMTGEIAEGSADGARQLPR
jgi:putative endonuclease